MIKTTSALCISAMLLGCTQSKQEQVGDPLELKVQIPRYEEDLKFISAPRPTGSTHWRAVRESAVEEFESLGYAVEVDSYGSGINIIARKPGNAVVKESVLVSAHYDSTQNCPGADDNASGVAGVLELARILSKGKYQRDLVLALWDEEEIDYLGSKAYAKAAKERGEKIYLSIVYEMIGFVNTEPGAQTIPKGLDQVFPEVVKFVEDREGRGDFLALVFNKSAEADLAPMVQASSKNALPILSLAVPDQLLSHPGIQDLRRSDHSSFWDQGFPAVMLTDTSEFRYKAYHCRDGADVVENLNSEFTSKVIQSTADALAMILGEALKNE